MNSYKIYNSIVILFFIICSGCASNSYSTLVGGEYDQKKDKTDYFVIPFGRGAFP